MRELELRRHAERTKDADALSAEGRAQAETVGRTLPTDFAVVFVSPARRTAETVAWLLRGSGQPVPTHAVVAGLASEVEDRWCSAKAAGSSRIDVVSAGDPELVSQEAERLAGVVRELFDHIPDGMKGLAIGHSPLIEAAVYGLMNLVVDSPASARASVSHPMIKGSCESLRFGFPQRGRDARPLSHLQRRARAPRIVRGGSWSGRMARFCPRPRGGIGARGLRGGPRGGLGMAADPVPVARSGRRAAHRANGQRPPRDRSG